MSHPIPSKNIERAIVKGAKKVIAESGLNPSTRSGNQELSHWATSLSSHPFPSLKAATAYGESLGQRIVERSQAMNKQYLDQGIIRYLRLQKDLPAIPAVATPASPTKSVEAPPSMAPNPAPQPSAPPAAKPQTASESTPEISAALVEPTATEEAMPEPETDQVVSIPVEPPESTDAAEVSDIEDSEPLPTDVEAAKVEIDPTPHITSAPEEPTSTAETIAQAEALEVETEDEDEIVSEEDADAQ